MLEIYVCPAESQELPTAQSEYCCDNEHGPETLAIKRLEEASHFGLTQCAHFLRANPWWSGEGSNVPMDEFVPPRVSYRSPKHSADMPDVARRHAVLQHRVKEMLHIAHGEVRQLAFAKGGLDMGADRRVVSRIG